MSFPEFSEEYPNKPPVVRFLSKMFHPNVYADGGICLDILQNRWSPTYDVSAILTSIQSLLDEPNPNSPANSVAAQLYQENRREYEKRVAAVVEQSAARRQVGLGDDQLFAPGEEALRQHEARVLWSSLHGIVSLEVAGKMGEGTSVDSLTGSLIENYVRALSARRG